MTNEIMTPLHVGIGDTIAALLFIFMREEDIHQHTNTTTTINSDYNYKLFDLH